jgi:hypothetical protein
MRPKGLSFPPQRVRLTERRRRPGPGWYPCRSPGWVPRRIPGQRGTSGGPVPHANLGETLEEPAAVVERGQDAGDLPAGVGEHLREQLPLGRVLEESRPGRLLAKDKVALVSAGAAEPVFPGRKVATRRPGALYQRRQSVSCGCGGTASHAM